MVMRLAPKPRLESGGVTDTSSGGKVSRGPPVGLAMLAQPVRLSTSEKPVNKKVMVYKACFTVIGFCETANLAGFPQKPPVSFSRSEKQTPLLVKEGLGRFRLLPRLVHLVRHRVCYLLRSCTNGSRLFRSRYRSRVTGFFAIRTRSAGLRFRRQPG